MRQKVGEGGVSERILETTFRLLSERGYARVSLRDIAREADVAVSQIPYYFKNRSGLFTALIERMVHVIAEELYPYLKRSGSRREWMESMGEFSRSFVKGHPRYTRVMLDLVSQSQWEPGFREELAQMYRRFHDRACEVLERDREDTREMFRYALSMIMSTAVQNMLGLRESPSGEMTLSAAQA